MSNKEKRLLRKFIFTLYITPLVRVKLIYQAFRWFYFVNGLDIKKELSDFIPNEIDRDIVQPYLTSIQKLCMNDFLLIYASTCKVLAERNK